MKTPHLPLSGRFLAISLLLSAGCTREKPVNVVSEPPKPSPAPAAAPAATSTTATTNSTLTPTPAPAAVATPAAAITDPVAEMSAALERATFDQHEGLSAIQQRMDQGLDAQVAAKKAAADVALASDQKLDTASTDFAEKLRMLTLASAETWNSAKHDTTQALKNVSEAYEEVMKSPARR